MLPDDEQTRQSLADDSSLGSELARGLLFMVGEQQLAPTVPNVLKVAKKTNDRLKDAVTKLERTQAKKTPEGQAQRGFGRADLAQNHGFCVLVLAACRCICGFACFAQQGPCGCSEQDGEARGPHSHRQPRAGRHAQNQAQLPP